MYVSGFCCSGKLMIEEPVHENQKNRKGKTSSGGGDWASADVRINRIQLEQDSGQCLERGCRSKSCLRCVEAERVVGGLRRDRHVVSRGSR